MVVWRYENKGKAGGKIDSDGTDRPETSGRFTEAKRTEKFCLKILNLFS